MRHSGHLGMKKCIGKILLPIGVCFLIGHALGGASEPVRLFVKEVPLKVLGKDVTVIAIEQADGTHGYSPEKKDGFHVEVVNQLKVPTSIGTRQSAERVGQLRARLDLVTLVVLKIITVASLIHPQRFNCRFINRSRNLKAVIALEIC